MISAGPKHEEQHSRLSRLPVTTAITITEVPKPGARRNSSEQRQQDGANRYSEAQSPSTVADQPHVDHRHGQILEAIAEALSVVTSQDAQGWFAHCDYRV